MTTTENNVAAQAGDQPMRQALQVCVKALEFRKERSANDEFALNLARIALAGSPRATADVEQESIAKLREMLQFALTQNECDMVLTGEECRKVSALLATTKPGA